MIVIYNVKLYTAAEVALILGVPVQTAYNYIKKGVLDATPLKGKTFVSEEALIRYLTGRAAKELKSNTPN